MRNPFTKGTWFHLAGGVIQTKDHHIARVASTPGVGWDPSTNQGADVRLIVESPRLLDLCERSLDVLDDQVHPELCRDLRIIIKRAAGALPDHLTTK